MYCSACGEQNLDADAKCHQCGAALQAAPAISGTPMPAKKPFAYYSGCFKQYFQFKGRARRAEYWWFFVVNLIPAVTLSLLDRMLGLVSESTGYGLISGLYIAVAFIPSLAVTVRRLHDTGRSGWWFLLSLIPVINIVLIILLALDGAKSANKYGESPKYC